ncbi:pca operon transcription factor PcaQ [Paraburkholderia hayleyella]|uniref:pca operon transcription factor PcaQ n=1 Tax=Paraburkholderia hayleyella TaxID=2152889 RepID=UPI001290A6EC|nr:pca operon transcription factor PcaQ [Paraburkholderia hayleyella]
MKRQGIDNRVKLRHLQCVLAVAQLGSMHKAAASLSLTQPAVSKTLAELETMLGVTLFERGRHGAVVTPEGALFMPHANACVSALRQGVDLLTRGDGSAAALEIGILPSVAPALVPLVLKRFAARWPHAVVRVTTAANNALLEQLKASVIEFAIGRIAEPERMVGLNFEQLYCDSLVAVVRPGHPLLHHEGLPTALLAQFPLVLPPLGTLIRQSAQSLLGAWGEPPLQAVVEVLSVSLGRALALENDAVWFVPASAVRYDLAYGALTRLPLPLVATDEPVGIVLRADSQPAPAGRAWLEIVREVGRELSGA